MSRIHYPSLTPPDPVVSFWRGRITLKASTDVPLSIGGNALVARLAARSVRYALAIVPHVSAVVRCLPDPRALTFDVTFEAGDGEDHDEDSKLAERELSALEDIAAAELAEALAIPDVEIEADHELDGLA